MKCEGSVSLRVSVMAAATTNAAAVLLELFLCVAVVQFSTCNGNPHMRCRAVERLALLKFKKSLENPHGRLSNWIGEDCCLWEGVHCNNRTGHVTMLNLGATYGPFSFEFYSDALGGEIDPSLLELKYLNYLNLSNNDFRGTSIPKFIGSLSRLRYLDISNTFFDGILPHQLGNLTDLRFLDLRWATDLRTINSDVDWLSQLSSLQYLDMSQNNLKGSDVFHAVSTLSKLSVLQLADCRLDRIPASLPNANLVSLATLDLIGNEFTTTVPLWLFNITSLASIYLGYSGMHGSISGFGNLTSLQVLYLGGSHFNTSTLANIENLCYLDTLGLSANEIRGDFSLLLESIAGCARHSLQILNLGDNQISGRLPDSLSMFRNLKHLHLYGNLLSGTIPRSLGQLSKLVDLKLDHNLLSGTIPQSLGQLSQLVDLDLGFNFLEGVVSEAHFASLNNLEDLSLSSNSLVVSVSSTWVPPFQLKTIDLHSCVLGPRFPVWLRTQRALSTIDISNASISYIKPNWSWNLPSQVYRLDLSHNQLSNNIPTLPDTIRELDLSSNQFHGPLPLVGKYMERLYLSNNSFSGDLLPLFKRNTRLSYVLFSRNLITGSIPTFICEMPNLQMLDLSNNLLSGEIPRCSRGHPNLFYLNLGSNNLSGVIPHWISSATNLNWLHLNNNSLHGEIPALENRTALQLLDLGENKLTGNIPTWMGEELMFLRLRSNMLEGSIPPQLSHLVHLQVLDLANNNLTGTIPRWLGNCSAMASTKQTMFVSWINDESLLVTSKGMELEYRKAKGLVVSLDLSGNYLSGDIPEELTTLIGLHNLNLAKNHLTGTIPNKIGSMRQLESLDLSHNYLSGSIPSSISSLTSLSYLNLSDNNITGRIPSGTQLQVLTDPSIYVGNRGLCGTPLPNKCQGDGQIPEVPTPPTGTREHGDSDDLWYYMGAMVGFVVGFWSICGPLLLKKSNSGFPPTTNSKSSRMLFREHQTITKRPP